MSDSIIVEVVTVEASTITVDVIAPPPVTLMIEAVAPPPAVAVIEIADWGSIPVGYPQLPAELSQIPIAFPFGDKPQAEMSVNVPMAFSVRVRPGLVGAVAYARVRPSAPATFFLHKIAIADDTETVLGTITLQPSDNTDVVLAGAGGELLVGDVMKMIAPTTQDPLMADIGITVLVDRE